MILARLILAGGLLASLGERVPAQDWAARYPPAPECEPQLRLSTTADSTLQRIGRARLVVLSQLLGATDRPFYHQAALAPVSRPLQLLPRRMKGEDTVRIRVLESDTAGAHVLYMGGIGLGRLIDTVPLRTGYSDTLTVWLRLFDDEYHNTYNCRPRGFRRPGESACVTDSMETEAVLARAREFAGSGSLKALGISPFDSSRVALIRQEKTCLRAAALYGEPNDPPRRVVVVRMGQHYLVYDPYEPLPAGEWNLWRIFDRRWRPVFDLMG